MWDGFYLLYLSLCVSMLPVGLNWSRLSQLFDVSENSEGRPTAQHKSKNG